MLGLPQRLRTCAGGHAVPSARNKEKIQHVALFEVFMLMGSTSIKET